MWSINSFEAATDVMFDSDKNGSNILRPCRERQKSLAAQKMTTKISDTEVICEELLQLEVEVQKVSPTR